MMPFSCWTHLDERSKSRTAPLPDDQEFELFTFDQALKEEDLSSEEILAGQIGGSKDGGLDGTFTGRLLCSRGILTMNGSLIRQLTMRYIFGRRLLSVE
jgi:hypothetical protein